MAKKQSPHLIRHPISLAAYALGLVFGVLATKNIDNWTWWPYVAAGLAGISVIGGLRLAHRQITSSTNAKPQPPKTTSVHKETHGDKSPIIDGVKGDVNLNYDSSQAIKKR